MAFYTLQIKKVFKKFPKDLFLSATLFFHRVDLQRVLQYLGHMVRD